LCRILFALDGDVVGEGSLDTLTSICLLRPLPIEETQWLIALERAQNDRRELCFVSMDRANVLLETAFDKSYRRMYLMTQYAAGVADGILALCRIRCLEEYRAFEDAKRQVLDAGIDVGFKNRNRCNHGEHVVQFR
jgi:hypothetical protein